MSSKRFYYLMIGITVLSGIAIVGTVIMANALLKAQSKKLYDQKLQSEVLNQEQVSLAQAKKDITKYSELNREATIIVPQDKDQAEAVREINNIAKSEGISLTSVQFPVSTLGSSSSNASAGTTPTTGSATATPKTPVVTQVQAVPGIKGVFVMPITIQVSNSPVSYSSFVSFLSKLEQNRRTAQVSSVSIVPLATDPTQINFTLIINVYIKP